MLAKNLVWADNEADERRKLRLKNKAITKIDMGPLSAPSMQIINEIMLWGAQCVSDEYGLLSLSFVEMPHDLVLQPEVLQLYLQKSKDKIEEIQFNRMHTTNETARNQFVKFTLDILMQNTSLQELDLSESGFTKEQGEAIIDKVLESNNKNLRSFDIS